MGLALTAAHLALIVWLTLRPHYVPWVAAPNLRPLETIRTDFALSLADGLRTTLSGLALLAPLAVLLPMAGGRLSASSLGSFARTVFVALMVSLGLEFVQTGVPGRVFDVDSILLNTVGVALVHLTVVPAARGRLRRRRYGAKTRRPTEGTQASPGVQGVPGAQGPQGSTPTISRVGIAP